VEDDRQFGRVSIPAPPHPPTYQGKQQRVVAVIKHVGEVSSQENLRNRLQHRRASRIWAAGLRGDAPFNYRSERARRMRPAADWQKVRWSRLAMRASIIPATGDFMFMHGYAMVT
jgi:hypothetical protein